MGVVKEQDRAKRPKENETNGSFLNVRRGEVGFVDVLFFSQKKRRPKREVGNQSVTSPERCGEEEERADALPCRGSLQARGSTSSPALRRGPTSLGTQRVSRRGSTSRRRLSTRATSSCPLCLTRRWTGRKKGISRSFEEQERRVVLLRSGTDHLPLGPSRGGARQRLRPHAPRRCTPGHGSGSTRQSGDRGGGSIQFVGVGASGAKEKCVVSSAMTDRSGRKGERVETETKELEGNSRARRSRGNPFDRTSVRV